ncbi:hypothetical protein SMD44_00190 [Streptomyces alboflavus]|uniref:Uncharacterized protein n=1 Tax=Streptomyces alboflavus TaxID=67267 RepID=A0A1Z1W2Z7_9ACTN|nr:hypothetical protein SMD44_00190 [Streptomyces alboflavus]
MRRFEVDEGGAQSGRRRTRGDALQHPGGSQDGHVTGGEEEDERDRLQRDRRGQHGPSAEVVRQRPDGEQGAQQADHVQGEDDGEHPCGEVPLLLVDRVERGRHAGGGQEDDEDGGHAGEGGPAWQTVGVLVGT